MEIRGFSPTSFIDYPGRLAAVIWTPNCNFRCPFCYNADLVLNQPGLTFFPEADILDYLKKNRKFLDGLVVTGGEATLQPDLPTFLAKVKTKNFLVKLDTNGSRSRVLQNLLRKRLVDYVALDIKAPLEAKRYCRAAGISAERCAQVLPEVNASVDLLLASGVEYEVRTTVAPDFLDEDDFLKIGRLLKTKNAASSCRYVIQNFFSAPTLNPECSLKKPWEKERLEALQESLRPFFKEVLIRNLTSIGLRIDNKTGRIKNGKQNH